ncbi:hypothetical protein GE09DRAFT_1236058 [Coniochaeta sp. 2T2.1]|nr:hypothetical protein GE09DRAFT_1236058 [Coniochaeta sp. 2T2.1]
MADLPEVTDAYYLYSCHARSLAWTDVSPRFVQDDMEDTEGFAIYEMAYHFIDMIEKDREVVLVLRATRCTSFRGTYSSPLAPTAPRKHTIWLIIEPGLGMEFVQLRWSFSTLKGDVAWATDDYFVEEFVEDMLAWDCEWPVIRLPPPSRTGSPLRDPARDYPRPHLLKPLLNLSREPSQEPTGESGFPGVADASQLSEEENKKIRAFLDYDMLASPNYAYQIYNSTNEDNPAGSQELRDLYIDWYEAHDLNYTFIEFDGRSDYVGFIRAGIPASGVATGAEGVKTEEEVSKFGGQAGAWYDACYHQLCDDVGNLNLTAWEVNSKGE